MRAKTSMGAPLLTVAGWWTLTGQGMGHHILQVAWSAVSAFCFIAFAQVYNDVVDVQLDAVSKPDRPLPSGAISLRSARLAAWGLAVGSALSGWEAGTTVLVISGCCVLAGMAYSLRLKGTMLLGNMTVALVSSAPFCLAAAVVLQLIPLLILGQCLIFFVILGNEFYKSAEDADGDSKHGIRTIGSAIPPPGIALAISLCWASLAAIFATSAFLGATAFATTGSVLVLVPAGIAVIASLRSRLTPLSMAIAGHKWWQRAWMFGLLTLIFLR